MKKIVTLEGIENIYMIGIKGAGMVGLAEILKAQGKKISGSDVKEKFFTDKILTKLKIKVYQGFDRKNLNKKRKIDLVIHSSAYTFDNNQELLLAQEKGLEILNYSEALGLIFNSKFGVAVCGSHGKTTVTAMLSILMREAGLDPTALIGSRIKQIDSGVLVGKSDFMVIEADEYQNKLAHYNPQKVILTNLDFDHPDYFKDFKAYKKVFKDFVKKIPVNGTLVVWGGSAAALEVAMEAKCKIIIYGFFKEEINFAGKDNINEREIYEIEEKFEKAGKRIFKVVVVPSKLKLKVAGQHNLLDATAALAMAKVLEISEDEAIKSLENFQGTERRLELIGKRKGALIVDDYAHHPEEIKASLQALKEKYPKRNLICVFHPHTFTRTKALLSEFSQSFNEADEVIVLDIYASAREKKGGVSAEDLVNKMKMFQQNVYHLKTMEDVYENLKNRLGNEDLVVTMGAGNVCDLASRLVKN